MEQLDRNKNRRKKIIIGISICVLCMAVILSAIFIALYYAGKGAQLYSHKYTWLDDEDGAVTLYEGRFIAGTDGGFVLCQYGNIISKTYARLEPLDESEGIYSFVTFDGKVGRLDKKGNEVVKTDRQGDSINDLKIERDFDFYLTYEGELVYANLDEQQSKAYSKIYRFSEFNDLGKKLKLPSNLPSGVFMAKDDMGRDIFTNIDGTITILADNISGFMGKVVVVSNSGEATKSYIMPTLEQVEQMNGVAISEMLKCDDAVAFFARHGQVDILDENNEVRQYSYSIKPNIFLLYSEGRFLMYNNSVEGVPAMLYDGSEMIKGRFLMRGDLVLVGSSVFSRNLKLLKSDVSGISFVSDGENTAYFLDKDVYTLDKDEIELRLSDATTTYGMEDFVVKTYLIADSASSVMKYELYYISSDTLYDARFKKVTELDGAEIAGYNLLKKGTKYFDFSMKRSIEDVVTVMSSDVKGEYIFELNDGFYTFENKISPKIEYSSIVTVLTSSNKDVIIKTKDALYHREAKLSYSDSAGLLGQDYVYTKSGNTIKTFRIERRSFKSILNYSGKVQSVVLSDERGLIFRADNGLYGFIGNKGKLVLAPQYSQMSLVDDFIAVSRNGQAALLFLNGSLASEFKYVDFVSFNGFVAALNPDGFYDLINSSGRVVLYSISLIVETKNLIRFNNYFVYDDSVDYWFVFSNGYYSLIKSRE